MVAGAERVEDFIPTDRWLGKVDLPGRIAFMSVPRSRGRSPRQGREEGAREPMRFYQQIKDNEDLAMLVVPPKFVEVMNTWLVIKRLAPARGQAIGEQAVRVLGTGPEIQGAHGAWTRLELLLPPPPDRPRRPRRCAHLRTRTEGSDLQP